MDAPAMFKTKHVPEDAGLRNIAAEEEGGQQQLHRDEKQHKPVLKKVKEKVKKIKNTIAGHGHGHDHEHGHETDTGGNNSSEEDEEDVAQRERELKAGGYQEDVEDKPLAPMESRSPELHGAPMYDSERVPAAMDHTKKGSGGAPGVRLGDLGGDVVEDPAAPRSTTPAPRGGEDIGTTDVVRDFESMTVSDDQPKQVGAGKMDVDIDKDREATAMPVSAGASGEEEWKDAPTETTEYTGSYTDRLKNTATGTTEYGKKLASTVYEKVAGVGTAVASKAQQVTPGFGSGAGNAQEKTDSDVDVSHLPREGTPLGAGTEEMKRAATDATTGGGAPAPGATYTDKIKSAAAGTTEYGKKLAGTVYEKVAGVTQSAGTATPGVGAQHEREHDPTAATATPGAGTEGLKTAATDAAKTGGGGAPAATYTDKIKSAAAGTTEYGKKLAGTVYEKVAGATQSAGTATPDVGAQRERGHDSTTATATPGAGRPGNGQDKGVSGVTAYIAEKLRPGDEERSLSEAITGAVQQRKEGVGSTVARAREVPAQAATRAREAVTSLTGGGGGTRVSETVQPTTEGNVIGEGVSAAEVPTLRGEEIGAVKNDNTHMM